MFSSRNFNINNNLKFFNVHYVYCTPNLNILNFSICKHFAILHERTRSINNGHAQCLLLAQPIKMLGIANCKWKCLYPVIGGQEVGADEKVNALSFSKRPH